MQKEIMSPWFMASWYRTNNLWPTHNPDPSGNNNNNNNKGKSASCAIEWAGKASLSINSLVVRPWTRANGKALAISLLPTPTLTLPQSVSLYKYQILAPHVLCSRYTCMILTAYGYFSSPRNMNTVLRADQRCHVCKDWFISSIKSKLR